MLLASIAPTVGGRATEMPVAKENRSRKSLREYKRTYEHTYLCPCGTPQKTKFPGKGMCMSEMGVSVVCVRSNGQKVCGNNILFKEIIWEVEI